MTINKEKIISRYRGLFDGYSKAHGIANPTGKTDERGKVIMRYSTVRKEMTDDVVEAHLRGNVGYGTIPLCDDGRTLKFGALDIDDYNISVEALSQRIKALGLPLVCCYSKSGGAHCYLFCKEAINADIVISVLNICANKLDFAGCEVFPKQIVRQSENALGNWINLPYFDAKDGSRFALHDGKRLNLVEFFDYAEEMSVTKEQLQDFIAENLPIRQKVPQNNRVLVSNETAGRNALIFKEAIRAHKQGASEDVIRNLAHERNDNATVEDHPNFSQGSLPIKEVENIVNSVMSYEGGSALSEDEALEGMNNKFAIVRENGKTVVMSKEYDAALKKGIIRRSSFADIKNYYKTPVLLDGGKKTTLLGQYWLNHPDARRYETVAFLPQEHKDGVYNLWFGFSVAPKKGSWRKLCRHMYYVICNGNKEHFKYLMRWLARMIQRPDLQGEVAIVLQGGRGVGKSLFFNMIGQLISSHFLVISNAKHLTGNFNAHLINASFVLCEEAFWAGDKQGEQILKILVTEPWLLIEPKGTDPYSARNYTHIAMTSNSDWVVPAGMDERRFFVMEASDRFAGDYKYFEEIVEEMENGGLEAMLHDLQNIDISDFNVRKVPESNALIKQKIYSMKPEMKWLFEKLNDGYWTDVPEAPKTWSPINKNIVQDDYCEALNKAGVKRRSMSTELGMFLNGIFPSLDSRRIKDNPHYIFPPLDECRKLFEKKLGSPINWL